MILLFFSFLISLSIAELVCRVVQLSNDSDPTYKLAHPVLPYVMKPNSESVSLWGHPIKINSHGLRDFEYAYDKAEGIFRILVLGDSQTFAYGSNMEDGYTKVLEKQLNAVANKKYRTIEVINSAHVSFNTLDEYNYLCLYGIKYAPDLLIMGVNSTDVAVETQKLVITDGVDSTPGSLWLYFPSWVKKSLRKSHLYIAIGWFYNNGYFSFRGQSHELSLKEEIKKKLEASEEIKGKLEASNDIFGKIFALASKNQFSVCIVSIPDRQETMSKAYMFPEFSQQLKSFERNGKAVFIDVMENYSPFSENTDEIYAIKDPAHPNTKGHQIIADRLYNNLVSKMQ